VTKGEDVTEGGMPMAEEIGTKGMLAAAEGDGALGEVLAKGEWPTLMGGVA